MEGKLLSINRKQQNQKITEDSINFDMQINEIQCKDFALE